MPEMNGIELTQSIRRAAQTPIIVLSVRDTDAMKIRALDEGADDYLTKLSACQNCLRASVLRCDGRPAPSLWKPVSAPAISSLTLTRMSSRLRGNPVHLTPKEFDLLLLARSPSRVLTRVRSACSVNPPSMCSS